MSTLPSPYSSLCTSAWREIIRPPLSMISLADMSSPALPMAFGSDNLAELTRSWFPMLLVLVSGVRLVEGTLLVGVSTGAEFGVDELEPGRPPPPHSSSPRHS